MLSSASNEMPTSILAGAEGVILFEEGWKVFDDQLILSLQCCSCFFFDNDKERPSLRMDICIGAKDVIINLVLWARPLGFH